MSVTEAISKVDPALAILGIMTIAVIAVLVAWHRDSDEPFNLQQLLQDSSTGKLSPEKSAYVLVLLIMTWGFIALYLRNSLTEWYCTLYASVFVLGRIASQVATVTRDIKTPPQKDKDDAQNP